MLSDPGPVRRRMAAKRSKKYERLNLEPVATVQTRSLRSRTITTETSVTTKTSPCSGQLSTRTNSERTIERYPGDNIEKQVKLTSLGLPEGWIKEVKPKRKKFRRKDTFYVDPKTGYAFYSLEDAVRYIQTGSILSCVVIPQKRSGEEMLVLMNNSEPRIMPSQKMKTRTAASSSEVKLNSDGLPDDWIKEAQPRKKDSNKKDWFYIEPKTGYAFRSSNDALRYLETGDILSCKSKPQKRSMEEIRILSSQIIETEIAVSPTQHPNLITDDEKSGELQCKVVQENQLTSYGLPTSWIKELKPRKNGSTKTDPFYIDPETGYAFVSLKDALRYLKTGNILSCIVRPGKRSIEEVQALMMSRKMPRLSGMKTVQQESVQCVQSHSLNQKTKIKRSSEDLKTLGTKTATEPASRRVKQRREGPLFVRASPRLLALKAELQANENYEENNDCSNNAKPDLSNSSAPSDLNRVLDNQSDPKSQEEVLAENGTSTRKVLHRGNTQAGRRTSFRASFHLATKKELTDTSIKNEDSVMSNAMSEPSLSLSHLNLRPSNHLELEFEETMEYANGSSTKTRSLGGMVRKGRRTPLRASSRLAVQKVTTDTITTENKNSTMSKVLEPSPSLSHLNQRPSNLSELKPEETMEYENDISTKTRSGGWRVRKERRTPLRASSRLAVQKVANDATSVENENNTSNALIGPLPSPPSYPTSQPEAELKVKTREGANISSTTTLMHREKPAPFRASSRLAAVDATSNGTSVKNDNNKSNALIGTLPSPPSYLNFKYLNFKPPSKPEAELKVKTKEGANSSSTTSLMHREKPTLFRASSSLAAVDATSSGTSVKNDNNTSNVHVGPLPSPPYLHFKPTSQPEAELKVKKKEGANDSSTTSLTQREKPTPFSASSRLAAVDATSDGTSVKNDNRVVFNPSPSFSSVNTACAIQPDLEFEEKLHAANGSLFEIPLQRGKEHRKRPISLKVSSHQASFKATTNCAAQKNEDCNASNSFFEPPTSRPDLNLESTSSPAMEFKEERATAANGRGPRTILQKEELLRERPATIINSSHLSALKSSLGTTSDVNHGDDKRIFSAVSEWSLPNAHPDLNFGPTSQSYSEHKEDAGTDSRIKTASWRVEPQRELPTSVKASPCLEALKVTSESTSRKINEKNSIATSAWSKSSHFPGRPDLNLGPTSQLTMEHHEENMNASATGTTPWRMNLHGVRPTPVISLSEAPSYYNYESNFKISNYFCEPVESPANQFNMGSTSQPNFGEVRFDTTTVGPSSVITVGREAPDLNMVPISWPEPVYCPERALEANPGPKLEQQQQPAGVNNLDEFQLQPHVHSEMPYQDPTMDALLSVQEVSPSMPNMSIDALHSPVSPFFGDLWHDPCLSYAFRTLSGGANQQQLNPGLGPENNGNWAGARNSYPSQNSSPSASRSRTLHNMNNGMPFPRR